MEVLISAYMNALSAKKTIKNLSKKINCISSYTVLSFTAAQILLVSRKKDKTLYTPTLRMFCALSSSVYYVRRSDIDVINRIL